MNKNNIFLITLMFIFTLFLTLFCVVNKSYAESTSLTDLEKIANKQSGAKMTVNEEMEELIAEWEIDGYPNSVGYVYNNSDSGKYILGLVKDNRIFKDEIHSMISNPEIVDFETATYAYNDLLAVQDEIVNKMVAQTEETRDIYSVATGWTMIDGKITGFGNNGKEPRVVVGVDKDSLGNYKKHFESLYGDMVYVEIVNPGVEDSIAVRNVNDTVNDTWIYITLITVLCFLIFVMFYIKHNGLILAKQIVNGGLTAELRPLRRNEVISAVKESVVEPSNNVYVILLKEIENR